ncbi:MAG: AmmeMemoRadiSam system protein A [Nanoarchaeota archaeon]
MDAKDHKILLSLARESILSYFSGQRPDTTRAKHLSEKQGCFVTLHKGGDLRGCIGFPYPLHPLFRGIVEAARSAAFGDPRFPPVEEAELKDIKIEISVLSVPEEVKVARAEEYLARIKIGRDGLILKGTYGSGLLLPQVATENGFTQAQFLNCLSQKAGLPFTAWKDLSNKIYTFQAEIFGD